jgi:DNA polymerase-3 subunit delta'
VASAHEGVWDVPGQARAVAVLRAAVARDEVGHAWAFTGPAGVGQEQAARALAAAVNCPHPEDAPCGVCAVCRRCLRGAFPAYWEFVPTGAMHRVTEVREQWLPAASRSAVEGCWKILRVVEADRMNEAAANAFLKALEEPPPATTWILDVADPDELPDTILSRCRELRFAPWSPDVLDAEAARLGLDEPDERALAVRAALGAPRALERLAAPGGLDDLRVHRAIPGRLRDEGPAAALVLARALDEEVKRRTAALKAAGKAELEALGELYGDTPPRAVVKQVTDRLARQERETKTATLQAALDDLVGWYRDCLLVGAGGNAADAVHADAADALRADADALGPALLLRAVDLVLATRASLEFNVQPALALEALFLELSALTLGR